MTTETILGAAKLLHVSKRHCVIFEIYPCCSGRSAVTLQSSHECHLVDRPSMVTWRAVGAGIVELVETSPKLDRRPRRMGTLGVAVLADPGDGGPKPKLNFNTLSTTRGNKYKLQKSASHYNLRKFSFCSRVVNIWNSLPDSVVDADTLNTFKNRLDKH